MSSKTILISLTILFFTACEKQEKSELQNTKWVCSDSIKTVGKSYPVFLTITEDEAVLESPGLNATYELASFVHQHGTSLAGKPASFSWKYVVESKNVIVLQGGLFKDNLQLTLRDGKLLWPRWRVKDDFAFHPTN